MSMVRPTLGSRTAKEQRRIRITNQVLVSEMTYNLTGNWHWVANPFCEFFWQQLMSVQLQLMLQNKLQSKNSVSQLICTLPRVDIDSVVVVSLSELITNQLASV